MLYSKVYRLLVLISDHMDDRTILYTVAKKMKKCVKGIMNFLESDKQKQLFVRHNMTLPV